MEPESIIYYFAFIKKRRLNTLSVASYTKPFHPWHKKQPRNFMHRLALETVLAGEYTSYAYMMDNLWGCFEAVDEYFIRTKSLCHTVHDFGCDLVSAISLQQARHIIHLRQTLLQETYQFFDQLEMDEEDTRMFKEEAADAFDFLLEILSLFPLNNRYSLLIIRSTKELTFHRFIPAPVC